VRRPEAEVAAVLPSDDMTASEDYPSRPLSTPKKRFIGKAKAEALRKKASEQSGVNIEDGVLTTRGIIIQSVHRT
jgi:hypothetical protein